MCLSPLLQYHLHSSLFHLSSDHVYLLSISVCLLVFPPFLPPSLPPSLPSSLSAYLAEGFLHLQNRVAQAIVDWKTQRANISTPRVHVSVKQIPYPSYRIDAFLNWNSAILPLLLVMAFIYSAGMFTKVQGKLFYSIRLHKLRNLLHVCLKFNAAKAIAAVQTFKISKLLRLVYV